MRHFLNFYSSGDIWFSELKIGITLA